MRRIALAGIATLAAVFLVTILAGPASADHDPPVVIHGDDGFETCECVDEGEGTEEDPYVIRDRHIEHPVVGVMLRDTSAHVVIEDVTFVADNENDDWMTQAQNLLEDAAFDPTSYFDASPGFTRGLFFDRVENADVVGFEAVEPEQGVRLASVEDGNLSVDVHTTPWNAKESGSEYEAGVSAIGVEDVNLEGSGETSHDPDNFLATYPRSTPWVQSKNDRPTVRVESGDMTIGPWNATGTTGIDGAGDEILVHKLTMEDEAGSIGVRSSFASVHLTDSSIDQPRGAALVKRSGDLTVSESEIKTWIVHEADEVTSSTITGYPGCTTEIEKQLNASIIETCSLDVPHVTDSMLRNVRLDPVSGSTTLLENATVRGERTALLVPPGAALRLEDTVVADAPAAIQPIADEDAAPRVALRDTRLEDSGFAPRLETEMASAEIEADNATIDGDLIHVADTANVTGGHFGALFIPSGEDPVVVEDVAVGAGGLHVWGRPSVTVNDSVLDGQGFAGISVSFVGELLVEDSTFNGPRHGILPIRDVEAITLAGVSFTDSGLAPPPVGTSVEITDSAVNDEPIEIVRSPTTVEGNVGQLFALGASNVTVSNATLQAAAPAIVARGTNLTLDNVTSEKSGAVVDLRNSKRLSIESSTLDASRTQARLLEGEFRALDSAFPSEAVDAVSAADVDRIQISDSEIAGPVHVRGADEIHVEQTLCECPQTVLAGERLTVQQLRIEGLLAHLLGKTNTDVDHLSFGGEVGVISEGPTHSFDDITVRSELNGLVFSPEGSSGPCEASLDGGNLLGSIWKATGDGCDATTNDVWWGSPGDPKNREHPGAESLAPRDEPLNQPPSVAIEPEDLLVENEASTLRASVEDDWMGSGPVTWDLPGGSLVGHLVHPVFPEPGSVSVQAASTDGFEATGETTEQLTVHDRPTIALDWEPDVVRANRTVELAAAVDDADGVAEIAIDVGADGTVDASSSTLSWTFTQPGDWLVAVEAVDGVGLERSIVDVVPVQAEGNTPPEVRLEAAVDDPVAPASLTLDIDASSTDDAIDRWRILVDGEPRVEGAGMPPSELGLRLAEHGLRSVLVEVLDENGAPGMDGLAVPIEPAPPRLSLEGTFVQGRPVDRVVSGEAPRLSIEVEDPDSEELHTEVCLTGAVRWCSTQTVADGHHDVQLPELPPGEVTLALRALDDAGKRAEIERGWTIEPNQPPRLDMTITHTNGSSLVQPQVQIEDPEQRPVSIEWLTPWDTHEQAAPVVEPQKRGVFPLHVTAEDSAGAVSTGQTLLVVDDEIEADARLVGAQGPTDPLHAFLYATWIDGTAPMDGLAHVEAIWEGLVVASETVKIDSVTTAAVLEPETGMWPPGDLTVTMDIQAPSPPGDPVRDLETAHLDQEVRR